MTINEQNIIKNHANNFDYIWSYLWSCDVTNIKKNNKYNLCEFKFKLMYSKYKDKIKNVKSNYPYLEWGFPKGKKKKMNPI